MYDNVNNNQTIEYDPKIISKIKEMIKEGFEKLKNLVITMKNSDYDIYYEVKRVLNKISNKLINIDLLKTNINTSFCLKMKYYISSIKIARIPHSAIVVSLWN